MKTPTSQQVLFVAIAAVCGLFFFVAISNSDVLGLPDDAHGPPDPSPPILEVNNLGSLEAVNDTLFTLDHTEGKSFSLSGQVWLNGPSPAGVLDNAPEGFSLYLRQTDDVHRYEFNSSFIRDKRRLLHGQPQTGIVRDAPFPNPALHEWIPFSLVVTGDKITYRFGQSSTAMAGPLDTDGNNQINLIAGTKLRNVKLEILGDAKHN